MARPPSDVRERIVRAAVRILGAGRRRFSQVEVAREADVQQGHLTYYFPTKEDLALAASRWFVGSTVDELQAFVAKALAAPTSGRSKSPLRWVLAFSRRLVRDRARTRTMLTLMLEAERSPVLRKTLVRNATRIRDGIGAALGPDVQARDVDLFVAALWGLGVAQLVFGRPEREVDALLDRLGDWLEAARRAD